MRFARTIGFLAGVLMAGWLLAEKIPTSRSGAWSQASVWAPGGFPGAADTAIVQDRVTVARRETAYAVTVGGDRPGVLQITAGGSIDRGDHVLEEIVVRPGSHLRLDGGTLHEVCRLHFLKPHESEEERHQLIRNVWFEPGSLDPSNAYDAMEAQRTGGVGSGRGSVGTRDLWVQQGAAFTLERGELTFFPSGPRTSEIQVEGQVVLGSATGEVKVSARPEIERFNFIVRRGGELRGRFVWPVEADALVQGRVVADGFGKPGDLDVSRLRLTAETVNAMGESGDPGRIGGWLEKGYGWWAINHGRLILPRGKAGRDNTVTVGQPADSTLTVVGALRAVGTRVFTAYLLAPDRAELAGLSGTVVSAWEVSNLGGPRALTLRWHDPRVRELGADPLSLQVWHRRWGGWRQLDDAIISAADMTATTPPVEDGLVAIVVPAQGGSIDWPRTDMGAKYVPFAMTDEEFNGPFSGWNDVKAFGAIGDGIADDTEAIQKAVQATLSDDKFVVYFPPGTYRITRTILLPAPNPNRVVFWNNVVIGHDPATTRLVWDGPALMDGAPPAMMHAQGTHSLRVGRLSFDGAGKAAGLRIERNAEDFGIYSSYGRMHDLWFYNCVIGFWNSDLMRPQSDMDSEYSLLRLRFYNCGFGVSIIPGNGYNYWVREGYFEDCNVGVHSAEGDFRVSNSVFRRSRIADVTSWGHRAGGVRDNVSIGSRRFALVRGNMVFQGNRIIDPIEDDAIQLHSVWGVVLLNNEVRSRPGARGPVVHEIHSNPPDKDGRQGPVFAMGNRFTVSDPIRLVAARQMVMETHLVERESISTEVQLPTNTPQAVQRQVFTAHTAGDLQAAIDQAAALARRDAAARPVVHLMPNIGKSAVPATVVIPADVRLSIQGDGMGSRLSWGGPPESSDPILRLEGPSRVEISDLFVINHDRQNVPVIVVENSDQPGGRVWYDNGYLPIAVRGLGQTNVDITDYMLGSVQVEGPTTPGPGRTALLGGAGSGDFLGLKVSNGGRLFACDIWFEDANIRQPWVIAHGRGAQPGELVLQSIFMFQPNAKEFPFIVAEDFVGRLTLIGLGNTGSAGVRGDGSGLSFLNLIGDSPLVMGTPGQGGSFDRVGPISGMDQAWLEEQLAFTLSMRWKAPRAATPEGTTDLRLRRICGLVPHGGGIELRP